MMSPDSTIKGNKAGRARVAQTLRPSRTYEPAKLELDRRPNNNPKKTQTRIMAIPLDQSIMAMPRLGLSCNINTKKGTENK
jgi:hypothetical protein